MANSCIVQSAVNRLINRNMAAEKLRGPYLSTVIRFVLTISPDRMKRLEPPSISKIPSKTVRKNVFSSSRLLFLVFFHGWLIGIRDLFTFGPGQFGIRKFPYVVNIDVGSRQFHFHRFHGFNHDL